MGTLFPTWLSQRLPSQCWVCRRWPAQPLCQDCYMRFQHTLARCTTCALTLPPHATPDAGPTQCGACLRQPPALRSCCAAVDYGYPWNELIAQWKFRATPALTQHWARWLQAAPAWPALRAQCTLTMPVPLAAARLRERGYNQALLLARALQAPSIQPHALLRVHDTPAQSSQNRRARLRNMRHAFAIPPTHTDRIAGQHVLLVDDVMTTGATLNAAAHCLLDAGAAQVHAVVLARTPGSAST